MTTRLLFPTWLLAYSTSIFAFSWPVAGFRTTMKATLESLPTDFTAANIAQPTWLILQLLSPAQTRLRCKERTFRTRLLVQMAIVWNLRVAAVLLAFTLESAGRRTSTAWQWRLEYSATAGTADLVKDSFSTGVARSFVAELWAGVVATF